MSTSIEIPNEDKLFHVVLINDALFYLEELSVKERVKEQLEPIDLINWLFEKAPFISHQYSYICLISVYKTKFLSRIK